MKAHTILQEKFPMEITPHVRMLGNYFFNLFLVTGQHKSALFESGISGGVDGVIAQLNALGISPDYLVPSHPQSDHITGLPGLMAQFALYTRENISNCMQLLIKRAMEA